MIEKPYQRRLTPEYRRSQLIALGRRAMSLAPLQEISISAIAAEANISKGLLYHYFGSKQGFYRAVVMDIGAELLEVTQPDPALPPIERLRHSISEYIAYVAENGPLFAAFVRHGPTTDTDLSDYMNSVRQQQADRITAGAQELGMEISPTELVLARAWVAYVEEIAVSILKMPQFDREEAIELSLAPLQNVITKALGQA